MRRIRIFEMPSLYREPMVITGYRFGKGEKSAAIVGAMRGNEIQQLYICSQLVRRLKTLEQEGLLTVGHAVEVIPCVNPSSVNIPTSIACSPVTTRAKQRNALLPVCFNI